MTGLDVYRKLMDLDLILQDGNKMVALRMFLDTIRDDHPSLVKLATEIDAFTFRLEQIIAALEGKE